MAFNVLILAFSCACARNWQSFGVKKIEAVAGEGYSIFLNFFVTFYRNLHISHQFFKETWYFHWTFDSGFHYHKVYFCSTEKASADADAYSENGPSGLMLLKYIDR